MKKNFLKRANRGLILAGVAFAVTAGYVTIDYSIFNSQKDTIEDITTSYLNELCAASVLPKEYQDDTYEWNKENSKAYTDGLVKLLDKYWTTKGELGTDYHTTYNAAKLYLNNNLAEETEYKGYITDYNTNLTMFKVSKNGPGAATVSARLNIVVDTYGPAILPLISESMYPEYYRTGDISEFFDKHIRVTYNTGIAGELLYEDGEWKISYLEEEINNYTPETIVVLD